MSHKHFNLNKSERKPTRLPPKPIPSRSVIPIFALTFMIHPGTHARCVGIIYTPNSSSPMPTFTQSLPLENVTFQTILYSILPLPLYSYCICRPGEALALFPGNTEIALWPLRFQSYSCWINLPHWTLSDVSQAQISSYSSSDESTSPHPITNATSFKVCCLG